MNAVGVDVGGTKIAAGVVTPEGKILDEVRYPTPHSPETLVETIARAISEVGDGPQVGGVCLAVPGLILAQANKVVFSPNLRAVEGIPLKDELEPKIEMPLTVENDGNAAAWGEFRFGVGQRGRSPGLRRARNRDRGRRHHSRHPDARRARLGRRARSRNHPCHRATLRLRQPRLPGGPGLRHGHRTSRPRACRRATPTRRWDAWPPAARY